jgi:hypothetical protein
VPAFHVMAAGCGGIIHRGLLGPTHCPFEPVVAGLWCAAHGRTAWLGFACGQHADQLIAPRELLPRDRDRSNGAAPSTARRWPGSGGRVSRRGRSLEVLRPSTSWSRRRRGPQPIRCLAPADRMGRSRPRCERPLSPSARAARSSPGSSWLCRQRRTSSASPQRDVPRTRPSANHQPRPRSSAAPRRRPGRAVRD